MFKRPRVLLLIGTLILLVVCVVLLYTPTLGNLWLVFTDTSDYRIPAESSIFTFRVIEMNDGTGGWWLYAEDQQYFYAYSETAQFQYHAFPKSKLAECVGFRLRDSRTWCPEFTISPRTESDANAWYGASL